MYCIFEFKFIHSHISVLLLNPNILKISWKTTATFPECSDNRTVWCLILKEEVLKIRRALILSDHSFFERGRTRDMRGRGRGRGWMAWPTKEKELDGDDDDVHDGDDKEKEVDNEWSEQEQNDEAHHWHDEDHQDELSSSREPELITS